MKAYKGTNENMMCRDFQYELGKEYTYKGEIKLCKSGFHACLNPIDCLTYYPCDGENRFFEVEIDEVSNEKSKDSKVVAKSIKFVREITDVNELLDGIKSIWGFSNNQALTSITIPNTVTLISSGAFHNCTSLTSIVIPDSVTSIGPSAFAYCSGLTSATIPDSVIEIGDYAFDICSSLTSIVIPDSVTSIGAGAFAYCSGLTSVTIGNSVTSIGKYAFYNCTSLTSINYNGTIAQWNAIITRIDWNYYVPSCIVHCIDGDIKI